MQISSRFRRMLLAAAALAGVALIGFPGTAYAEATLRKYVATLSSQQAEQGDGERQIELSILVHDGEGDQRELIWVQTQADVRQFSWLHRFGKNAYTVANPAEVAWPLIRFDWGEGISYVPVQLAIPLPSEPLTTGSTWEKEGLTYEVTAGEMLGDLGVWRVSVKNQFGEKRVVLIEAARPVVVALRETVFLGQGQQHTLRMELQESQAVDEATWQQALADFQHFEKLRGALGGATELEDRAWTDEQLAAMKKELPALENQVASEPFKKLFRFASSESKFERGRAGALDEMRRLALERQLPEFELQTVAGDQLTRSDLENAVIILHFWDYRDTPLREPYGQVGYLDFLFRKYEDRGVRVLGVVINQQAEIPEQRRSAISSARRFASFMNLAYPLYVDDGSLLKEIGDPRTCDSPLPLFVVVGRDGQIKHYSAGYYQVKANEGLLELEAAVKGALDSGE